MQIEEWKSSYQSALFQRCVNAGEFPSFLRELLETPMLHCASENAGEKFKATDTVTLALRILTDYFGAM